MDSAKSVLIPMISECLGRDVSSEEGTIQSFDAFTESDLGDVRRPGKVSLVPAVFYIRFKMGDRSHLGDAIEFFERVREQS